MKRIFLLLATIGSMFLTACSTQDDTSHLEIKSSASTFENPYLFIGRGCVIIDYGHLWCTLLLY
ncbi:hypothetical protein, partial [Hallella sp.]|uniref:hypothetical protein n=1 Tax=Hallella sp. TaxID=2980186 RepID=UPI00307FC6B7